jgi:hypothetical protein
MHEMEEHLIKDDFTDNVDKTIVSKVLKVAKVILILFVCYTALDLLRWFSILQTKVIGHKASPNATFYISAFAMSLFLLVINIIGRLLYLNGSKLIFSSIETNDPFRFNQGYRMIYKTILIALLTISLEIVFSFVKIFYFHQL